MRLRAYHSDPALKQKYVARLQRHVQAGTLVRGPTSMWNATHRRGCAISCTIQTYDLDAYERELGIPAQLAAVKDVFHEQLSHKWKSWAGDFLQAVPVGADLSRVWPRFAMYMLTDAVWGMPKLGLLPIMDADLRDAHTLLTRYVRGMPPSYEAWAELTRRVRVTRGRLLQLPDTQPGRAVNILCNTALAHLGRSMSRSPAFAGYCVAVCHDAYFIGRVMKDNVADIRKGAHPHWWSHARAHLLWLLSTTHLEQRPAQRYMRTFREA